MAEVKRYTASIMHPGVREDPEGLLVAYHHYAELKSEVEELTGLLKASTYYNTSDEVTRLKAEVERLTPLLGDIVSFDEYHKLLQQVERLTKAGDAVALDYAERIEIEAGETAEQLMKSLPVLVDWNKAKQP
jgi:hypothetical protein